jgi:hypothetical protein
MRISSSTSGFSRRCISGVREFAVEAKNLRSVIKAVDRLYPGLGEHLVEKTVAAPPPRVLGLYSLLRREVAKLAPLSLLKSSRVPSGSATKRA